MATLEDIAKKVGVSKSTVSKALNGAGDVSEAMRRMVLEAAVELGYTRLRRNDDTPKLAVFITNMEYSCREDFGYDIIVGFRKMAEPDGFLTDIIPLTIGMEENCRYESYMMEHNYRGALFLGLSLDHPWLEEFKTCRIPTVLYDNRILGNPHVTYVGADNQEAMHAAVRYLMSLGHQQIGYLGSALGAYVYQQRYRAFFEALREYGLPSNPTRAGTNHDTEECIRLHLSRLLDMGCTAIVCSHDILARRVLECCRDKGLRIPEQISVIGFDDLPFCKSTVPPLTTIRQNRTEIGKSAFCALSSQLENVPLSTFLLHTELIARGSCGSIT
jgi:DNA-binding LacI/PurR family transcriptional regulator